MSYPGNGGDIARISIMADLSEAVYAHGWHGPPMGDVDDELEGDHPAADD